jgi:hypothetical protein
LFSFLKLMMILSDFVKLIFKTFDDHMFEKIL